VFINPDFPGVKTKSLGFILAFARMVEMKHLSSGCRFHLLGFCFLPLSITISEAKSVFVRQKQMLSKPHDQGSPRYMETGQAES
jgi:hypothetical protein